MLKKILMMLLTIFILYFLQYLAFPLLGYGLGGGNEESAFLISSILSFSILGLVFISDKLRYWLFCDLLYPVLIFIYHPEKIYGIGTRIRFGAGSVVYNREDAWFGILILTVELIIIQSITWIFVKVIRRVLSKRKGC